MSTGLEASTLPGYLVHRGLVTADERVVVEELAGGVSCSVFGVRTPARSLVVKQALPRLRVSADWHADPERAGNEAAALSAFSALTPAATPALLDEDPVNHVLAMTRAPAEWRTWKQQLLAGHVDTATARRLGTVLGTWHAGTRTPSALPARFLDLTGFQQLRIAPYYRTVQQRHPAHADAIDRVVEDMLAHRSCLVHGDFSPKNVLVGETGSWVIDFEVAHYGDPTFDVAFLLTHLVLKAAHLPTLVEPLRACAHKFLGAYGQTVSPRLVAPTSRLTDQLGCLLLARVDGSSPAEYLTPEQQIAVRGIALALIEQRLHALDEVFAIAGATR